MVIQQSLEEQRQLKVNNKDKIPVIEAEVFESKNDDLEEKQTNFNLPVPVEPGSTLVLSNSEQLADVIIQEPHFVNIMQSADPSDSNSI